VLNRRAMAMVNVVPVALDITVPDAGEGHPCLDIGEAKESFGVVR